MTGSFVGTLSFIGENALLVLGVGRGDAAMVRSHGRRIPSTTLLHYSEIQRAGPLKSASAGTTASPELRRPSRRA